MQISKMKVGTMYLINTRQNWRERNYGNQAYILMSKDAYVAGRSTWHTRYVYETVTIEGVEYSHTGKPWYDYHGAASKLYLMQLVNPETREPILNDKDGKPFLSLISTRTVRGEWAEVKARQDKTMEAERKRLDAEVRETQHRWNRAEGTAIRLRSLLGLPSNSFAVNPVSLSYAPSSVKIDLTHAEALADNLTEAHQEIEDLKAELRDLRG